jgi:hypothetical protein
VERVKDGIYILKNEMKMLKERWKQGRLIDFIPKLIGGRFGKGL